MMSATNGAAAMPQDTPKFSIATYFITACVAFACWQQSWYFASVLALTIGGGLVMSRPVISGSKLLLRGTPVMLMFSVMLGSASAMAVVSNQVGNWIAPADDQCECLAGDCGDGQAGGVAASVSGVTR